MSWWFAIPAALQGISAITQASAASKQNQSQYATNLYNAQMGYSVAQNNMMSQMTIAGMNFGMAAGAAQLNMQLARFNANIIKNTTNFNIKLVEASNLRNAEIIAATTGYNNSLLDTEIEDLWEAAELDITLLEQQRAREAGTLVAIQADSGTVIGEGSNADVIIDQKAQAALDELVVRHRADEEATQIRNQQAKNTWQGQMSIYNLTWEGELQRNKMLFEGAMGMQSTLMQGAMQAGQQMIQAAAQYGSSAIGAMAGMQSAGYQYQADIYNAQTTFGQNKTQIRSNLLTGLFGAVSTGVSGYYATKQPTSGLGNSYLGATYPGGGRTAEGYSYVRPPTITDPGGSLFGTSYK